MCHFFTLIHSALVEVSDFTQDLKFLVPLCPSDMLSAEKQGFGLTSSCAGEGVDGSTKLAHTARKGIAYSAKRLS